RGPCCSIRRRAGRATFRRIIKSACALTKILEQVIEEGVAIRRVDLRAPTGHLGEFAVPLSPSQVLLANHVVLVASKAGIFERAGLCRFGGDRRRLEGRARERVTSTVHIYA